MNDPGTMSEPHKTALTNGEQGPSKKDTQPRPSCPYYPDPDSGLACPYYLIARTSMGGEKVNWAGMASLILGILCMCLCWLSLFLFPVIIFLVMSVLIIIFGGLGIYSGRKSGSGRISSTAGLVLGILSLVFTIVFYVMALAWSD